MPNYHYEAKCEEGHRICDRIKARNLKSALDKAIQEAGDIFGKHRGKVIVEVFPMFDNTKNQIQEPEE